MYFRCVRSTLEITFPSNNNSNFVHLRRILGQLQSPEIPILLTIPTQNTIILHSASRPPHHLLPPLTQSCILKPEYRLLHPTDPRTASTLSLPRPPPAVVSPIPLSGRTIPPLSTYSPRNPLPTPHPIRPIRPSVSSRLTTRIIPSLRSAIANPITTPMHQIRTPPMHPILTMVHPIRTRLPAATAPSPAGSPARRGSKWSRRAS